MIHINPWSIVAALATFGVLILIHEFGHFITARAFGVTVKEFSVGMGPKLISRTSRESGTVYSLRLLPIGGYVAMEGEDEESDDENAFNKKAVWKRMLITAAGAITNILLGIIVMFFIVNAQEALPSNTVSGFATSESGYCASYGAGLRVGDRIVEVDGVKVHIADEISYEIMRRGIEPIDITVIRDGETVVIEDVSFGTVIESGTTFGAIDFGVYAEEKTAVNVLRHTFYRSTSAIKMIWESLYDIVTGRYGAESISGPIGVTKVLGEAAEQSMASFFYLAVFISINLGVMNLLPIPALDGGRLVFQLIELVRRKPIKPAVEGYIHFAGIVLLMLLIIIVSVKDVISLF